MSDLVSKVKQIGDKAPKPDTDGEQPKTSAAKA
jgi:hypothetical protein